MVWYGTVQYSTVWYGMVPAPLSINVTEVDALHSIEAVQGLGAHGLKGDRIDILLQSQNSVQHTFHFRISSLSIPLKMCLVELLNRPDVGGW